MLSSREFSIVCREGTADVSGIAGRLAAKEAVFKLLHTSGEVLPWRGIEILQGVGGWPEVWLTGRAARLAAEAHICGVEISIAHDEPCAIAVACAVYSLPAPDTAKK
jgi:holo-[acyl-carrier protein] synthase